VEPRTPSFGERRQQLSIDIRFAAPAAESLP